MTKPNIHPPIVPSLPFESQACSPSPAPSIVPMEELLCSYAEREYEGTLQAIRSAQTELQLIGEAAVRRGEALAVEKLYRALDQVPPEACDDATANYAAAMERLLPALARVLEAAGTESADAVVPEFDTGVYLPQCCMCERTATRASVSPKTLDIVWACGEHQGSAAKMMPWAYFVSAEEDASKAAKSKVAG